MRGVRNSLPASMLRPAPPRPQWRCTECDETYTAAARCHPGVGGVEEVHTP